MFERMGRSDCRVAVNCAFRWRGFKCGFVGTGGPTHTSRVLLKTLSAHYASPGRLAKYKRQFERMTRLPGDDPAAFAIELETLARKAFVDVDASVRLQLVRDRFIIGQEHRDLRRHLDSVGPDTPISDIVDRCRVWESHDESNSRPMGLDTKRRVLVGFFKLHNRSAMNTARCSQNRTQPRRNSKYLPNGCVKWHSSRCRQFPTR